MSAANFHDVTVRIVVRQVDATIAIDHGDNVDRETELLFDFPA